MAAGEHQFQPIVWDLGIVHFRLYRGSGKIGCGGAVDIGHAKVSAAIYDAASLPAFESGG